MDGFAKALVSNGKKDSIPDEYNYFGKLIGEGDLVNTFDNQVK